MHDIISFGLGELQNNECVIEGFISAADNQSFDNQKDETLEDRLIVKCKSDTFASTREISQDIAEMSTVGNEKLNIQKVTLPITQEGITFESMKSKRSSKHSYIFRMLNPKYKRVSKL